MKKVLPLIICFLLPVSFLAGCKKESAVVNENGQVVVQGKFILKVRAMHHGWAVPDLPLYLKKNATEWPGLDSSKYEFNAVTNHAGYCEFNHLFPGNYFVYAHGFDVVAGAMVIGYQGVAIKTSSAPGNTIELTLLVSE